MYEALIAKSELKEQSRQGVILKAKSNYAVCLHHLKDYKQAHQVYLSLIGEEESIYGAKHEETLLTKSSLMTTRWNCSKR